MMSKAEFIAMLLSLIACSLILGIAVLHSGLSAFSTPYLLAYVSVFYGLVFGSAFVVHEFGHKLAARKFGLQEHYTMWLPGLLLGFVVALFGKVFIAPGAVMIYGRKITEEENGLISLAGPLSNLLFGAIFIILSQFIEVHFLIGSILPSAAGINFVLGFFNMLPFGPLDGRKVMQWNKIVWLLIIALLGYMAFFR